jgi:hypothetical protein
MQLPNEKGVLLEDPNRLAQAKFEKLVLAEFPQLQQEFTEAEGLIHLQMGSFSRFAQAAMERNDLDTLRRCYHLVAEIMNTAPSELENAIYVSFLENLDFESSSYGGEARRLLPSVLEKALDEVNEHWERIGKQQVEAQDRQQRAREEEARNKPPRI